MFTGIVSRTCLIKGWERGQEVARLWLDRSPTTRTDEAEPEWDDLAVGESISVNGCCLTLVEFDTERLGFDLIPETLERTALGDLAEGRRVNLERALRMGDRLGGHYVTGHIDTIGVLSEIQHVGEEIRLRVEVPSTFISIPKGSVTLDGISLTLVDAPAGHFSVAIIPHTWEKTQLSDRKVGERVNVETDHFGKWVEALQAQRATIEP